MWKVPQRVCSCSSYNPVVCPHRAAAASLDMALVTQLMLECAGDLRTLQQTRGVLSLSAPTDSTALLVSGAYQFLGGFHQLSLSTRFSLQPAVLRELLLHPSRHCPPTGKGPLQNRSSTLSSAAEKVQCRETGTIHWTDGAAAMVEYLLPPRLGAQKGSCIR